MAASRDAPKWAMAGRSKDKLAEVRDLIGAPAETPLIVADADDPGSLDAMCHRTRVVLTTVGPYQLYGSELVAACARSGTDYADLCGEPAWMREMIDAHHEHAKASGRADRVLERVRFDPVRSRRADAAERGGRSASASPPRACAGGCATMKGTFSGGTAASLTATMKAVAKNPKLVAVLQSPFALTPGFEGPTSRWASCRTTRTTSAAGPRRSSWRRSTSRTSTAPTSCSASPMARTSATTR